MKITLEQIQRLQEQTKAGMSDCKKALEECNGDEARAAFQMDVYKNIGGRCFYYVCVSHNFVFQSKNT